jgi:hypothetical protein
VGPKIGGQNQQNNDQVGPVFTGGWVHSLSGVTCQGQQLGSALLKDAFLRTVNVSENVGIRALLVHAIDDAAKQFYTRRGFQPSPVFPYTLMLKLPGAS